MLPVNSRLAAFKRIFFRERRKPFETYLKEPMPSQTVDRRRGVQSGCIIHSELLILRRHEIPPKQLIEFKQRCSDGYRENSFVEELNKKSAPCPDCNPIENIIPEVGQWAAMWTASYIPLLLSTLFVLFQYTMTVDAVSKKKKKFMIYGEDGVICICYMAHS